MVIKSLSLASSAKLAQLVMHAHVNTMGVKVL